MIEIVTVPTLDSLLQMVATLPEEQTLLFCEDRLTFALEEAITQIRGVTFDIEVTTFSRFVKRHIPQERILSSQGAVLKIASILAKERENLTYLGKNPIAYAKVIYATLSQLRACNIQPQELMQAMEESALKYKLQDLTIVYNAYMAYVQQNQMTDDNILLSLLPEALQMAELDKTHILFVGYTAFTKQAEYAIKTAMQIAKKVSGIFIGGKERFYCNHALASFQACANCANERHLASTLSPMAEYLRQNYATIAKVQQETDCITLLEAEDREQEVIEVAKLIKQKVAQGARYSDFAIYVSDVAGYAKTIERVFRYYALTYYIDTKMEITEHPLAQCITLFFRLGVEYFEPDTVDLFLSNHYLNADRVVKESYRNYLKCYANYNGGFKKPFKNLTKEEQYAEELPIFYKLQQSILPYIDRMQGKQSGAEFCRILIDFLKEQGVEERTEELAMQFNGVDRQFIEHGGKKLLDFIAEVEQILAEDSFTVGDFVQLLEQSMQSIEGVTFLPQHIDEIYIGSLAESRTKSKKYLCVLGLTSDVPSQQLDTGLISDRDIDALRDYQLKIDPKIKDINKRLTERIILNLASFTEELFISYPKTSGGNSVQKSNIIDRLNALFTLKTLKEQSVNLPLEYYPSMQNLLVEVEKYRCKLTAEILPLQTFASFMQLQNGDTKGYIDRISYEEIPPAKQINNAADLLLAKESISASFIERHYTCPYKNFLERGLRLSKETEGIVDVRDIGTLIHAVLEKITKKIGQTNKAWLTNALPTLRQEIEEITGEELEKSKFRYLTETEEERYKKVICQEVASYLLTTVTQNLVDSDYQIIGVEQPFSIPLKKGRLIGVIDRVDKDSQTGMLRVIDYKTGNSILRAEDYYAGKKVQLPLYLFAVSQNGEEIDNSSYFAAKIEYTEFGKKQEFEKKLFSARGDKELNKGGYIRYAMALAEKCYAEILQGKLPPSPYEESCKACDFGGICRYSTQFGVRTVRKVNKENIANCIDETLNESVHEDIENGENENG